MVSSAIHDGKLQSLTRKPPFPVDRSQVHPLPRASPRPRPRPAREGRHEDCRRHFPSRDRGEGAEPGERAGGWAGSNGQEGKPNSHERGSGRQGLDTAGTC